MANPAPKAFQNPAPHSPKPSKIEPRGVQGGQNAPRKRPRPARRCPRAPKMRPRDVQEAPRKGQETPKSVQQPPQKRPRPLQKRGRRVPRQLFSMIFLGSAARKASETILHRFVGCARCSRYVANLQKPRKNCGFCTSAAFSLCRHACAQKH